MIARRLWLVCLLGSLLLSACSGDATEESTTAASLDELATYEGEDWLEVMRNGASKEGAISVYTAIPPKTIQPLLDEFSTEFSVDVELYSATAEDIRKRLVQEQQADRFSVDLVLGGDVLQHMILEQEKALQPFTTPSAAEYDDARMDDDRTWYALYENYFVVAYNTDLIKSASAPATYEDLLAAKWKGRLGIEASDVGWFATLVDHWGTDDGSRYFAELAAQQPFVVSGHTTLTNLVISGEVPLALNIYNYRAELEKQEGAPIEWVPLEPSVAIYNGVAVPRNAPHPHAALAMAEFLLSEDGQAQLAELTGQIPSHPDVPASPPSLKQGFETIPTSYELLLNDYETWWRRWEQTMINGKPTAGGS